MSSQQDKKSQIDFIGIGAPKGGSTWLASCLEEHPDILFSSQKTRKEIFFFNTPEGWVWNDKKVGRMSYYDRGLAWYLDQFPDYVEGKIRGEFTTSYLSDDLAYNRIHESFPNVKILATLRNPVDMIYSLHWYLYHGAVVELAEDFEHNLDAGIFNDKGLYFKHLQKYFETFPAENIKVLIFDDIKSDPINTISSVYEFLGVDSDYMPATLEKKVNTAFKPRSKLLKDAVNKTLNALDSLGLDSLRLKIFESQLLQDIYTKINKTPTKYPPMSDEVRKKAYDVFASDINALENLLKRDLSAWKI